MLRAGIKLKLILLFDALLFFLCITGLINIDHKAKLPFDLSGQESPLTIINPGKHITEITSGDKLVSLDGFRIGSLEKTEFITDRFNIGDDIPLTVVTRSGKQNLNVKLTKYYSAVYIISTAIAAMLFFFIALFVLIKKQEMKAAVIFHWACISVSLMLCLTWSNLNTLSFISQYISRTVLLISYVAAPALFVHFTLVFPRDNAYRWRYLLRINYCLAFILSVLGIYAFVYSVSFTDDNSIDRYLTVFNFLRIFLTAGVVLSITIFAITLYKEKSEIERKQLKWLLFGFVIGPLSFVILWVVPILATGKALIPEEIVMILVCAIPITFAIAIIKYHLLDIDEVLNRGLVYGIVIAILLALYSVVIWFAASSMKISDQSTVSAVAAVVLALIFQPIKTHVQEFVDRKFFRIRYNFRKELNRFTIGIKAFNDVDSLSNYIITEIDRLIPVDKIAFCDFNTQRNRVIIKNHRNFDILAGKSLRIKRETLERNWFEIAAARGKVENEADISALFQNTLIRWRINLVVPIKSVTGELFGFLILGDKKSGSKFTTEDVDLLEDIGLNAGSTIERLKLEEQLIRKKIEAERLEELNRQKSMFVSTVSHELKTPLTSIRIFSDLIGQNEPDISDVSRKHLEIIEGESNRLTRLINNVLDFSKIERGIKDYSFREVHLNKLVKEVVAMMQYQLRMGGFRLETCFNEFEDVIYADPDAVTEAVENIISNAIRFSREKKEIMIGTYEDNNFCCVDIRDSGIGLEPGETEKIFEQFYRSKNAKSRNIDGTGLGLPIVKHILEDHKGRINVESKLGEGSKFTLCFPKLKGGDYNEKNFNN